MDENFAFAGHRCGMLAFREGEHHQIGGKHLRLESAATGRLGDWADWSARQPRTSHHVDAQKLGGQRPALAGPGSPRGFTKESRQRSFALYRLASTKRLLCVLFRRA